MGRSGQSCTIDLALFDRMTGVPSCPSRQTWLSALLTWSDSNLVIFASEFTASYWRYYSLLGCREPSHGIAAMPALYLACIYPATMVALPTEVQRYRRLSTLHCISTAQ